jgi:hypothetical protein
MTRPRLDGWGDFGSDFEYASAPFLEFQARVNAEGCAAFKAAHPEFPATEKNSQALIDWCEAKLAPLTRRNLEIAFGELQAEEKLEAKPVAQEAIGNLFQKETQIRPAEGRLAAAEPTPEEAAELETVKDDPTLTDHSRKKRDAKLRDLANKQRRVRRDSAGVTHI